MLREERRDASKLYNPMRIDELSTLDPSTPWLEYINRYTVYSLAYIAVVISCTGPLGEKKGNLPYPSGPSPLRTCLALGHLLIVNIVNIL